MYFRIITFLILGLISLSFMFSSSDSDVSLQIKEVKEVHINEEVKVSDINNIGIKEDKQEVFLSETPDEQIDNQIYVREIIQKDLSIDDSYVNEEILKEIESIEDVIAYSGITFSYDIEELYDLLSDERGLSISANIELIDPYGSVVYFDNCDGNTNSKSINMRNMNSSYGIVCKNEDTQDYLSFRIKKVIKRDIQKINENEPIEEKIYFSEKNGYKRELINGIEIYSEPEYTLIYEIENNYLGYHYTGVVEGAEKSGVVVSTKPENSKFGVYF